MARFRLLQRSYLPRSPGGLPEQLDVDAEITLDLSLMSPGPHMHPLDEEAKQAMEAYRRAHPRASLNPTGQLPLTGADPMAAGGGTAFDQAVQRILDSRLAAASAAPTPGADAELKAMAAKMAAMERELAALKSERAPPPRGQGAQK
jgi:hypothetical protein